MNNFGGTILKPLFWQVAVPANANRTEVTVQNTAAGHQKFDRDGVNDGPPIYVWAFDTAPTDGSTLGASLLRRVGDGIRISGTASKAAIYVLAEHGGSRFAASEF